MCLYPKLVKNPKYKKNKKNGGIIPAVSDKRVLYAPVGCGKCMECKKKKARDWNVRLHEEIKNDDRGKFVTLSFSDEELTKLENEINGLEGYELDNDVATLAVRRYLERWRKKHKKSVKHWFVTELGQTASERIHLHGIMWTNNVEDIEKIWKYGHVYIGEYVNERTVNYIVKYMHKTDEKHKEYQSKMLTSAGIGKGYTERINAKNNKFKGKDTKEYYITKEGTKLALPIYYRNKLYNDEEREKLWLYKLDEEVRYVDGTKIDISKGEEGYYKKLEEARKINKRLGYGDDSVDWDRKKYENERRNLKKLERIKKRNSG